VRSHWRNTPRGTELARTVTRPAGRRLRSRSVAAAALAATLLAVVLPATAALAGGGTSIVGATRAQANVTEFGNTVTDASLPGDLPEDAVCTKDEQFWSVALTAGDQVTAEVNATAPAADFDIEFLPIGTDDQDVENGSYPSALYSNGTPFESGALDQVVEFTVPVTGVYPFIVGPDCDGGVNGPYNFTISVTHAALVFAPSTISTGTTGSLPVVVRNPVGTPITSKELTVLVYGSWKDTSYTPDSLHLLARLHPVHGMVTAHFTLPARLAKTKVVLVVSADGGHYRNEHNVICVDSVT
jgi:hypothetical protein